MDIISLEQYFVTLKFCHSSQVVTFVNLPVYYRNKIKDGAFQNRLRLSVKECVIWVLNYIKMF